MNLQEEHAEVPRKSVNERRVERCHVIIHKKMQELCEIHPPNKGMPRRRNSSAAKDLRGKISKTVREIRRAHRVKERHLAKVGAPALLPASLPELDSNRVMFFDPYYDRTIG